MIDWMGLPRSAVPPEARDLADSLTASDGTPLLVAAACECFRAKTTRRSKANRAIPASAEADR
ncbi:hypothetical protein [Streptomyces sp. Tu 3180]|uniref:hypothetical protein n=1 Tax=Streptomyces sp. Tu 3180 TaxID=2682611 RepID=UPI001356E933|nr:hypothetical protein [Streptomyces sp. Tu 3180]KAF3463389.1 hypothetical protein GL259_02945 [Streptomyces sp. Tu 3180]